MDADALWGRYPPPLQEHKYCSTIARNKETLDPLNLHFLHFLLHSIKALYLTQRDSCWKAAKALSTLFFPLNKSVMVQQRLRRGGGDLKKGFCRLKVRNSFVFIHLAYSTINTHVREGIGGTYRVCSWDAGFMCLVWSGGPTWGFNVHWHTWTHTSSACRESDFQLAQNHFSSLDLTDYS